MPVTLTADDARLSLTAHVQARGEEIHAKYGPQIGWSQLILILEDRACVRYPCEIVFDSKPLRPGECAYPVPMGDRPEDGFRMHVHSIFLARLRDVVFVVLYQLVAVNYGEFASTSDAEAFGAAVLGMDKEEYYAALCAIHDEVGGIQNC